MTADTREPRRDFDPRNRENPWWKGGNLSQIFNSVLYWDGSGRVDMSDQYLLARALGFGKWSSNESFIEALKEEGRTPLRSISRFRDGDHGFHYSFKRYTGKIGVPEMHIRDDGLWIPFESGYVYDGQYFSVRTRGFGGDTGTGNFLEEKYISIVGEDVASRETDPHNHTYPVVEGTFLPNGQIAQNFPGGYIKFLYVWDRSEGELLLKKVDGVALGRKVERARTQVDWADASGNDTDVAVAPFGTFVIPGKMTEQEWLKNYLFPRTYPWHEDNITPRDLVYNEQAFGYNIFNIQPRKDWVHTLFDGMATNF